MVHAVTKDHRSAEDVRQDWLRALRKVIGEWQLRSSATKRECPRDSELNRSRRNLKEVCHSGSVTIPASKRNMNSVLSNQKRVRESSLEEESATDGTVEDAMNEYLDQNREVVSRDDFHDNGLGFEESMPLDSDAAVDGIETPQFTASELQRIHQSMAAQVAISGFSAVQSSSANVVIPSSLEVQVGHVELPAPSARPIDESGRQMEVDDDCGSARVDIGVGDGLSRPCFRFSTKTSNTFLLYLAPMTILLIVYLLLSSCELT